MLTATVRRTWAPRGRGPLLDCWDRRDRLSAISCLTRSPKIGRLNLHFRLSPDHIDAEEVVDFLKELKEQLRNPFTLLWDRSKTPNKSRLVQAFLAKHPAIVAEDLPAYAPELNPDELVRAWSKHGRLAHRAADNTDHWAAYGVDELLYLQEHPHLLASFLKTTELPIAA